MTVYLLSLDGTTVVGNGETGAPWTPTLATDDPTAARGWIDLPDDDDRVVAYLNTPPAVAPLSTSEQTALALITAGVIQPSAYDDATLQRIHTAATANKVAIPDQLSSAVAAAAQPIQQAKT